MSTGKSDTSLVIKYVQNLQQHLNETDSDEQRLILSLNCLEEIKGKELALAIDSTCSRVLESIAEILASLSASPPTEELKDKALAGFNRLFTTIGWAILSLAGDTFGSHLLESIITLATDLKGKEGVKIEETIFEGMFSIIHSDESWIKMTQHFSATHVIRKLITFACIHNKSLLKNPINELIKEISTETEYRKAHESILFGPSSAATICHIITALEADKELQARLIDSIFNNYGEDMDKAIDYMYAKKPSNRILETCITYLDTEHLDIVCRKWLLPKATHVACDKLGNFVAQKIIESHYILPQTFLSIVTSLDFAKILEAQTGAVIWKICATASRLNIGCAEALEKVLLALRIDIKKDKWRAWDSLFQLTSADLIEESDQSISQTGCSIILSLLTFPKSSHKLLKLLSKLKSFIKHHKSDGYLEKLSTHPVASRVIQAIVDPRNKCPPKIIKRVINVYLKKDLIDNIYSNINGSFLIGSLYRSADAATKGLILKKLSRFADVHHKLAETVGLGVYKNKRAAWKKEVDKSDKVKKLFRDLLE